LRSAALQFEDASAPDAWLRAALDDTADTVTLSEFVWRLVLEVIERRAACLVGPRQVAEYGPELGNGGGSQPQTRLGDVLRHLLGLGIWAVNREAVLGAIRQAPGRNAADIGETLVARLRPRRVEIHVNPRTLATLLSDPPSRSRSIAVYAAPVSDQVRADFQETEESVYLDFGLRLPDLFWVPSEQVAEEMVAVRINDCVGIGLPLPPEGMVLVNAVPSSLPSFDVLPALGPAGASALISADDAATVEAMGYKTFDRLAFVRYLVFADVRRNAARLLSVRDVEFELERAGEPALVRAVLQRWSLGDVTRVLRLLLDGGLSIRDMRTILERLLRFDTIEADADSSTVFDERLAVAGALPTAPQARTRMLARFVREGMSDIIGSRFSFGTETMVCYLLDPSFEQLALEVAPDDFEGDIERSEVETTLDLLRETVWKQLSLLPPAAAIPVVLTSRRARNAVRRVLAPELPDLRVVRYSEIPASLNVMPVARIALAPSPAEVAAG
jgi:type III secretory pathway component EscV